LPAIWSRVFQPDAGIDKSALPQEAGALIKQTIPTSSDKVVEQLEQDEQTHPAVKETFVEPTVSVATDVLDATAFFQQPTIEGSTI
jgi:hypothetical protein